MATKLFDIETIHCPICQNVINPVLFNKLGLTENDLTLVEGLIYQKSLIPFLELGKLASKYLKPESLGTEIQVKESLGKLSDKATELIDKSRKLTDDFVKATQDEKIQITKEFLDTQKQDILRFQEEIKNLEKEYNDLEKKHLDEIEKLKLSIQQIHERILGTGIGGVRELTVIKDLKAACPEDEFSDESAKKHGADIVAKVKTRGHVLGLIVISVKDVEKWNNSFIEQVKNNMNEEKTQWSILVTKTFPSSALNDKAYLDDNGILLVKAEYAPAAYIGLRYAVIEWNQAKTWMKTQEEKTTMQEHILLVLREWIQGNKFSELLSRIDDAINSTKKTDELIQKWQNYNEKQAKDTRELQDKIRGSLFQCNDILNDLRNKFQDKA